MFDQAEDDLDEGQEQVPVPFQESADDGGAEDEVEDGCQAVEESGEDLSGGEGAPVVFVHFFSFVLVWCCLLL